MKTNLFKLFFFLFFVASVQAQEETSFYATMDSEDARNLKIELPNEVEIIATEGNQSAVYISRLATLEIQEILSLHGPGYVFEPSLEKALISIETEPLSNQNKTVNFTITEDVLVNQALDMVDGDNIENDILLLESYGTRYHTKASATQSVYDLKDKWEAMALAAGRTDVSVRIFDHSGTNMPSVIMTIEGAETPDDYIIIGGHMDSINQSNNDDAPGADDNASGIATITEISRVLFDMDFVPKKTVEFMAFAAEEIGLVGSSEIAEEYNFNNINVEAFVQFDMTNYAGSTNDVYISTDSYTSSSLNTFLIDLIGHYNSSGDHQFTYGTTACNYGCSDHFSWAQQGYDAAFPFEAAFGEHSPFIHSSQDLYIMMGTTEHATKFAKLGVEFIIESAKGNVLSVNDYLNNKMLMLVKDGQLTYRLIDLNDTILEVSIYDISGKKIINQQSNQQSGTISLQNLDSGFYIATFNFSKNGYMAKKFILK